MSYILLILFPLAMSGGCFVLRRSTTLVTWAGVLTIAVELWLAFAAPIDQPAQLLEIGIGYNELGRLFLVTFCIGSLITALIGLAIPHNEHFIASLLLILSLSAAILIVQEPFVVATLLLLASLVGGLELVDQPVDNPTLLHPRTIGLALKYTLLVTLGGMLLLIGFVLATAYEQQLATSGPALTRVVFGLLLIGYAIRAGVMPFHLWLPDIVEENHPTIMFLQAGLLTILALPVLLVALQTQPELLVGNTSGQRLLLGLGTLSAVLGSTIALMTQHPRRALAFFIIANIGLLTIGLSIGTVVAVSATLLGALNHVVGVALIALGMSLLERNVPGRREQAGALRERPIAALALLLGVLIVLGVPPVSGFVPKMLLVVAAHGESWLIMISLIIGLSLSGLAAARILRQVLLRPRETPTTRSLFSDDFDRLGVVNVPYAPRFLLFLILALGVGTVMAGVWPQPIMSQMDDMVRTLSFLRQ